MMHKLSSTFFLPGRFVSRFASYLSDVKDLTMQGTTEPRRFIGCIEEFWLNVANDHADWLREIGYGDEPNAAFPRAQVIMISPDHPVVCVTIEVPARVFAEFETKEVVIYPSPLEARGTVVGFPGTNLRVDQPNVTIDKRRTRLRIFDLPKLQSGMELRGVVWAARISRGEHRPAPLVIASLCFRVL